MSTQEQQSINVRPAILFVSLLVAQIYGVILDEILAVWLKKKYIIFLPLVK